MFKATAIMVGMYISISLIEKIFKADSMGYWKGGVIAVLSIIALLVTLFILVGIATRPNI